MTESKLEVDLGIQISIQMNDLNLHPEFHMTNSLLDNSLSLRIETAAKVQQHLIAAKG